MLTAKEDTFDVIRNRDIVFRYAAYGDFAAGDGLVVQGRIGADVAEVARPDRRQKWRYSARHCQGQFGVSTYCHSQMIPLTPYGELRNVLPHDVVISNARSVAIDTNGDALGNCTGILPSTLRLRDLWRINLNDPDDETGDYGIDWPDLWFDQLRPR